MNVPIPISLARRPQYKGLPVPFIVFVDEGGIPRFSINNAGRWLEAAKGDLCSLCGESLGGVGAFVAEQSALETLIFGEPPAHPACAKYALAVCPHLVSGFSRKGSHPIPAGATQIKHGLEGPPASDVFVLCLARDYDFGQTIQGAPVTIIQAAWRVMWYRGGQQILPPP